MTFKEALEREIASQGLSVAEITRISGVSKGTIYNILNGTTVEARIRPSTRRSIARGCNRELRSLEDGGVLFVERGAPDASEAPSDVRLNLLPNRPFLSDRFLKEPFDWLHTLEEEGALSGIQAVDRVFQKREEFLGLVMENGGEVGLMEVRFDLRVAFEDGGPSRVFPCRLQQQVGPGRTLEETVFLLAGPPYVLELLNPAFTDSEGQTGGIGDPAVYHFRG